MLLSNLKNIKVALLRDGNIHKILELMACSHIDEEQGGSLVTAMLPESYGSNNKRAVQVRMNDSMGCAIRNRADFKGDIFDLVSYIRFEKRGADIQANLKKSADFISKAIGIDYSDFEGDIVVKDYSACLKELIYNGDDLYSLRNETIPETALDDYVNIPFYDWIEEGISYKTQMFYGVGFDLESKRITIPMRDRDGNLIGVKARIMKDEDDDRKYLYLHSYNNHYELFNYHIAKKFVKSKKKIYLFEGEKSCMKMFQNKMYNAVSVGSSSISDVQVEKIRRLGEDVDVIICFDKDAKPKDIKDMVEVFKDNNVYGIVDTDNLLGEKDSPIDCGIEIFKQLEKNNCYPISIAS